MVEVKAHARRDADRTDVSVSFDGTGIDIVNEVVTIIQAVMGDLKKQSKALHLIAVKAIADDPSILLGEDEDDRETTFEEMHRIKIREGVN